jgi:hypothetical protein
LTQAAEADRLDLWYLDEAGFAPTLPTGYTRARRGVRPLVRNEAPQGRRLNALGALAPCGPLPRLVFQTRLGKLDSRAFLDFICHWVAGLPPAPDGVPAGYRRTRPRVIILDNYSVHRSVLVNAVRPRLEHAGVRLYFLPPYSPELNRMEPEWRAPMGTTPPWCDTAAARPPFAERPSSRVSWTVFIIRRNAFCCRRCRISNWQTVHHSQDQEPAGHRLREHQVRQQGLAGFALAVRPPSCGSAR